MSLPQLRYEIAAEAPLTARVCWCRVCQYLGAGSGTANALFAKDAVKVTGDLKSYRSVADSGSVMHRSFCRPAARRSSAKPSRARM